MVRLLLGHEDIDPNGNGLNTPLGCAVLNGNTKIVELLLGHKDINPNLACLNYDHKISYLLPNYRVDGIGNTPLYLACLKGNTKIVRFLLDHKDINPNIENSDGDTPLHYACCNGHTEIVKLLLERNDININEKDVFGATPLCFACCNGHTEIVKLLLERDDIRVNEKENTNGCTPLHCACCIYISIC